MWLAELRLDKMIRYRSSAPTCVGPDAVNCLSSLISDISIDDDLKTFGERLARQNINHTNSKMMESDGMGCIEN